MRKERGITLIALIITIIILLILAMVTIRILMNQGIIKHAENATNSYVVEQEKERIALGYQNYKMDIVTNPNAKLKVDGANGNNPIEKNANKIWTIIFDDTQHEYTLKEDGTVIAKSNEDTGDTSQDLSLLERYCLGEDKTGLNLLNDVLDVSTYPNLTFKDKEPIPDASTSLTYTNMETGEKNGQEIIYIYFSYNETPYKLISTEDTITNEYTTQSVEVIPFSLDKASIILGIDEENNVKGSATLSARFYGGASRDITWSIADSGIATINQTTGTSIEITAAAKGETTITAVMGETSAVCNVTVGTGYKMGDVVLPIGGYVAYDATKDASGNAVPTTSYTSYAEANAASNLNSGRTSGYTSDQTFNVNNYTSGWRVLGVKNGKLQLISASSVGSIQMQGQKGYTYAENELNAIAAIYGQGKGAIGAKSIDADDINEITGYNPANTGTGEACNKGTIYEYGNNLTYYWKGNQYPYYSGTNGVTGSLSSAHSTSFNWWDGSTWQSFPKSTTASDTEEGRERITTVKNTDYYYYPYSLSTDSSTSGERKGLATDSVEYSMLFNSGRYWLASRMVSTGTYCVNFGMRIVDSSNVSSVSLCGSYGHANDPGYDVRPIVTLSENIQIKGDASHDGSSANSAYIIE